MVGKRVPGELTMEDAHLYIATVKEGFSDEPGKYNEFLNILSNYKDCTIDCISTVAKVQEFMKEHPKLLLGFSLFLPDMAKMTDPPEAKTTTILDAKTTVLSTEAEHHHVVYTKTERVESDQGASYIDKLKTRFRSLDTHVVGSFHEIMKRFEEGTMSKKKVYEEVVDLLYYHEDLIDEFPTYFKHRRSSVK